MENMELKVLVTGGTGFIGSNLIKKLIGYGIDVYALIRPESTNGTRRLDSFANVKYIYSSAKNLILEEDLPQFDICFNLASYGVDYRQQDTSDMIDGNIKFILDIIDFCKKNRTKRLIHTGSCFEYGTNDAKPIKEDADLNPHSLYATSKVAGGIMANAYAKCKKIKMITVRPFGVYGIDEGMHRLVPQLIETIVKKKKMDMTLGEQVRDYLFVDDLVDAYISIATDDKVEDYEVYNISSSEEITVKQLVNTLCNVCDYDQDNFNYGKISYRYNEVMYFVGDNSKICNTTYWKPKTSLEEGLRLTYEWYKCRWEENNA